MTTFKNTFTQTLETIQKGNKKEIFNHIYLNQGEIAETIMMFLRDCSTTFVKDICARSLEQIENNFTSYSSNGYRISEKQSWCLVFEAIKIQHLLEAWIESEMKAIKEETNEVEVYEFEDGEIRFETTREEKIQIILWGKKDVSFIKRSATEEEKRAERLRVEQIEDEAFDNVLDNYYIEAENRIALNPKL